MAASTNDDSQPSAPAPLAIALPVAVKVVGTVAVIAVAMFALLAWYRQDATKDALLAQSKASLEALRNSRARAIEYYFARLRSSVSVAASSGTVKRAVELSDGLQPNVAVLANQWSREFSWYDLLLVDRQGVVFYTLKKESDFGTNLVTGPFADSGLAQAASLAMKSRQPRDTFMVDYRPYAPSGGIPAAFVSAPVFGADAETPVGAMVVQVSIDDVDQLMNDVAGLGETGETYIIGPDYLLRTNSRFSEASTMLIQAARTDAAGLAIAGESGVLDQSNYRGRPALAAYSPLPIPEVRWSIIAEVDRAEVLIPLDELTSEVILIFLTSSALGVALLALALRLTVLVPVAALATAAGRVERGDLKQRVHISTRDEFEQLGRTFNGMVDSVQGLVRRQAEFVSFASHQLRTPLTGINWMLELARDEADAETRDGYIRDAQSAAQRLIGLVNNLLDSARLEGGRVVLDAVPVDLTALTNDVISEIHPLMDEKRQQFSMTAVPATVLADRKLMREVTQNLLSNAVKYTPARGTVSVSVSIEAGVARWSVTDSGIGVPEADRAKLFEKFHRSENARTLETEGTGLGLYLASLIVTQSGGRIWHEPAAGGGSIFIFTLPVHTQDTDGQPTT